MAKDIGRAQQLIQYNWYFWYTLVSIICVNFASFTSQTLLKFVFINISYKFIVDCYSWSRDLLLFNSSSSELISCFNSSSMDLHRPRQESDAELPQLPAEVLENIFGNLTSNRSDVSSFFNVSYTFYQIARPMRWREPQFRHNLDLQTLQQIVTSCEVTPPIKVLKLSQFDSHYFCNNPDSKIEELVVFILKHFKLSSFHMDARLPCRDARYWDDDRYHSPPPSPPTHPWGHLALDCSHGFITTLTQVNCFLQLPVDRFYTCLLAQSEKTEHSEYPYLRHPFPVTEFMDVLWAMDPTPKLVMDTFFYDRLEFDKDWLKLSTLPTYHFSWVLGRIVSTAASLHCIREWIMEPNMEWYLKPPFLKGI